MNTADFVIIAILLLMCGYGWWKGFIHVFFRFCSTLVALLAAWKLSGLMAALLRSTPVYSATHNSIVKTLLLAWNSGGKAQTDQAGNAAMEQMVSQLALPGFLKESVIKGASSQLPGASSLVDIAKIAGIVADQLTDIAMHALGIILVYVLARVLLWVAQHMLEGVAQLPVLKQANRTAGLAVGLVQGMISLMLGITVIYALQSVRVFHQASNALDQSFLGSFLYHQNPLWSFLFGMIKS